MKSIGIIYQSSIVMKKLWTGDKAETKTMARDRLQREYHFGVSHCIRLRQPRDGPRLEFGGLVGVPHWWDFGLDKRLALRKGKHLELPHWIRQRDRLVLLISRRSPFCGRLVAGVFWDFNGLGLDRVVDQARK